MNNPEKVLNRMKGSRFYSIMRDEPIDTSIISHLVIFSFVLDNGFCITTFLGLLYIQNSSKEVVDIFQTLTTNMKD